MVEVYCTNCGKKHTSASNVCEYCGEDLTDVILRQKQKHLPIKYEQSIPPQQYGEGIEGEIERERKPVATFFRVSGPIFFLLLIVIGVLIINRGYFDLWAYILAGIFGVLFIVFSIIGSALSPRRRRTCGGTSYSGCDCGGCTNSDCGDCNGDCGCGDCGGCDCGGCDC